MSGCFSATYPSIKNVALVPASSSIFNSLSPAALIRSSKPSHSEYGISRPWYQSSKSIVRAFVTVEFAIAQKIKDGNQRANREPRLSAVGGGPYESAGKSLPVTNWTILSPNSRIRRIHHRDTEGTESESRL